MTEVKATYLTKKVLLVLLTDAGNLDGGTIQRLCGTWSIAAVRVFTALDILEEAAWITSEWTPSSPTVSVQRRRFYSLTPNGRLQALRMLGLTERRASND